MSFVPRSGSFGRGTKKEADQLLLFFVIQFLVLAYRYLEHHTLLQCRVIHSDFFS